MAAAQSLYPELPFEDDVENVPVLDRQRALAAIAAQGEDIVVCGVCLGPVCDNLQCADCRNAFCRDCITAWFGSGKTKACPTCRQPDLDRFVQSAEVEAKMNSKPYVCEYGCKTDLTIGTKKAHLAACGRAPAQCPYVGCTVTLAREDLDKHTFCCPFSNQYNASSILARIAAAHASAGVLADAELYEAFLREKPRDPPGPLPSGTTRHVVKDSDTLAGIALRYGTTKEHLRRTNKLVSDTIFANTVMVVPQVDGAKAASDEPPPEPPKEVVLALHRRRLARQVMVLAQITSQEAIAYLRLARYNVANAVAMCREDNDWARTHTFRPPKTLKEFLQRAAAAPRPTCSHCRGAVTDEKRRTCPACGNILCFACIAKRGDFAASIPRRALGVTAPGRRDELLEVCAACAHRK